MGHLNKRYTIKDHLIKGKKFYVHAIHLEMCVNYQFYYIVNLILDSRFLIVSCFFITTTQTIILWPLLKNK